LLVEKSSIEPLPYCNIRVNEKGLITDENGRFSFRTMSLSANVKFRTLGYETLDTLLINGNSLTIALNPKAFELDEIVIIGIKEEVPVTNVGEEAGHMKFNDINNNLIPGLSNNLIFNNLRLYPGIMAAGESIADFVIWGSYAGQNHVIYDGISLFNSWGINDDIGRVNPYMIKNVEVYKGGYNVQYGDRIGGVVLIDGKSGNRKKAEGKLSLTNQLVSAYLNIPMFNHSSTLQIGWRKTYSEQFGLSVDYGENEEIIVPTYDYSDYNFKFTSSFKNSDKLEISAIASQDLYNGLLKSEIRRAIVKDINIKSDQTGSSIKYSKNWSKGGLSVFAISQSYYRPKLSTNYFREESLPFAGGTLRLETWTNPIEEYSGRVTHTFAANGKHQIQLNSGFISNKIVLKSNGIDKILNDTSEQLDRFTFYSHDQIQWTDRFSMQLGLKTDIPTLNSKLFMQPRINGRIDLLKKWNIHFGWGLYNQFVTKNSIIDKLGNQTDIWQVTDGEREPVLKSTHNVLGLSYISNLFEVSLEGYYKTSSGFSRYNINRDATLLVQGDVQAIGFDVFVRKRILNHIFWGSYSLAQVEERFGNGFRNSIYTLAPQSQRHEVKAALILNFNRFKFSTTNVYGSGFPNSTLNSDRKEFIPYWRTDLAAQYEFEVRKLHLETGLSVLNLFNRKNLRLNQSVNVPDGAVINTIGIPFAPTFYLNFRF